LISFPHPKIILYTPGIITCFWCSLGFLNKEKPEEKLLSSPEMVLTKQNKKNIKPEKINQSQKNLEEKFKNFLTIML